MILPLPSTSIPNPHKLLLYGEHDHRMHINYSFRLHYLYGIILYDVLVSANVNPAFLSYVLQYLFHLVYYSYLKSLSLGIARDIVYIEKYIYTLEAIRKRRIEKTLQTGLVLEETAIYIFMVYTRSLGGPRS